MAFFSVNYDTNMIVALPPTSGVPQSALNGVSPQYIVAITASFGVPVWNQFGMINGLASDAFREFTVYAFLQEKIHLRAASDWEGITESIPGVSEIASAADTASQALAGRSTISTWSTRRKWAGSEPISFNLKLKFEAFSDPYREVMLPCIGLQGLTLPRGGRLTANGFLLIPPGPNPFDLSNKGGAATERNENISLNIGNFLKFGSVIIKTVNVTFENRMGSKGPIGAEVDLSIETYQMLTREDLYKAINSNNVSLETVTGNVGI